MCAVCKINYYSFWKGKIPQYLYYLLLHIREINPPFFRARIQATFLSEILFAEYVCQPCLHRKLTMGTVRGVSSFGFIFYFLKSYRHLG